MGLTSVVVGSEERGETVNAVKEELREKKGALEKAPFPAFRHDVERPA